MSQYYTQPTLLDLDAEPRYTFAEVKWGKIVAIHQHWVPLSEFQRFFEANTLLIDITGVLINGEPPVVGDVVYSDEHGYNIQHLKSVFSPAETKAYIIERLKLIRNVKELEVIEYNNNLFDADKDSLERMDKARKLLEDNNQPSITWTTAENTRVEVTINDFKGINTAIAVRSNLLHVRYNQLKQYILGLDDKYLAIIPTIDWNWDMTQDLDVLLEEINSEEE